MTPSSTLTTSSSEKEIQVLDNQAGSERLSASTDTPLEYHLLTFETPLPDVDNWNDGQCQDAPPVPDLTQYTSPFEWPRSRKNITTAISCATTMFTAYAAGAYSPPSLEMSRYWHISQVATQVGITTYCFGFAVAPMVMAPFSEINGRRPVFMVTGILFVICSACVAVTRSYPGMLLARFFSGVGASTFSTMVGGVISDIYHKEDRNTPMALFAGSALFGTGFGPLCSGIIVQHLDWRWVFYVQIIFSGVCIGLVCLFFKETRGSVLLSRKARALNQWYQAREDAGLSGVILLREDGTPHAQERRIRWKVKEDEERQTLLQTIGISIYRPFHLLIFEPVVFFFSLWTAFSWAVLYLTFSSIPVVFSANHHFTIEQSGAVFTAMCIGALLATVMSIYQERFAQKRDLLPASPEARLYFSCVEAALMPIGMFWFGWTCYPSVHWISPAIAIGCATMGIFSVYLAVFNYLADSYNTWASSALAAQSFARNALGGIFPLVTPALYNNLGFQAASSLLGGIGALLTVVPWVLVFFGPQIRGRSKIASSITLAEKKGHDKEEEKT